MALFHTELYMTLVFIHFIYFYYFTCVGVWPACMSVYHVECGAHGIENRASDPLKLEVQMTVSHSVSLGIKSRYSERASSALQC